MTNHILHKTKMIDDKFKEIRIGAFEVQLCYSKSPGNRREVSLFSKLQSGTWPSLSGVLNRIVAHMPLISCEISLYDQEAEHYEGNKEQILETKLEGIKLNLYKHNNKQIENLLLASKDGLDKIIDPKKRIAAQKKKESMLNIALAQSHETLYSPTDSQPKGELLITLYSNRQGKIFIQDIPYDSYFLEREESSSYQHSTLVLNFKQIESQKKVQKFVGLKSQPNSFVKVFVFHNIEEIISSCDVLLHSNSVTSEEKLLFEEQETKIKLKESQTIKGRYEGVLVPGKYTLSVSKKGFDIARKQIQLNSGENKINIELVPEQSYMLKVQVLNYENYSPVENALIKLSFGNEEEASEGVTSTEGSYTFSATMKEDFVSVFVEKPGFLPGQRTYIRDVAGKQVEETVTRTIIVVLVKELFILKENAVVMVTYSNLLDDNFEPVYLYSKNSKLVNYLVGNFTDINCNDSQVENGILTSYFKFRKLK